MSYSGEFELYLCAIWANYTYEGFKQLEGDQQALHLQAYRDKQRLDAVMSYDQQHEKK